jgi:ADP-heptose:LPS heptosyltransferase
LRLGDNVVSEPTFRAIKSWNKEGELVALTNKYMQEFVEEIGSVDRVVVAFGKGLPNLIRTIRMLRKEYFDLVIDVTSDYTIRPALIAFFCKSGYTLGYNIQGRGFLFMNRKK